MKIEISRLNHFTLKAPSGEQEKVRWFYGIILGLQEVPIPKDLQKVYEIVWFKLLDFLLHIEFVKNYEIPPLEYENGIVVTPHHIALEVKNISALRKEWEKKKVTIVEAVKISDRDRFYLLDPFGNFFEIIEFHTK